MVAKIKLNAKQLRQTNPTAEQLAKIKTNPIAFVLDNIIDTYNIGSFFRLGDALAIEKLYLCGRVVTPPNPKIHRASVGTWRWVAWEHYRETETAIKKLKKAGWQIVAVEQDKNSIDYRQFKPKFPVALIFGNETAGVSSPILKQADVIVELPLWGVNRSLNVFAAAAVVGYWVASFLS